MWYFTYYVSNPQFKMFVQFKFGNFGGKTTNVLTNFIANDRYLYKCLLIICTGMLHHWKLIQYFLYILLHTLFSHQTFLAWTEWISSIMIEKWILFTSYRMLLYCWRMLPDMNYNPFYVLAHYWIYIIMLFWYFYTYV